MAIKQLKDSRARVAAVPVVAVVFVILVVLLYRAASATPSVDVSGETSARAASVATALSTQLAADEQFTAAAASASGLPQALLAPHGPAAGQVLTALRTLQSGISQVAGFYYFNAASVFAFGLNADRTRLPQQGAAAAGCDSTGISCVASALPSLSYFSSDSFHNNLTQVLQPGSRPQVVLAFDRHAGPYGTLLIFQQVAGGTAGRPAGALVASLDPTALLAPYLQPGTNSTLLLAGPIVLAADAAAYHNRGELPVASTAGLDLAVVGGLSIVPAAYDLSGSHPAFSLNGTAVQGTAASVTAAPFTVVSFAPAPAGGGQVLLLLTLVLVLGLGGCAGMYIYFTGRRLRDDQLAVVTRSKSEQLTEDIVAVAQALSVARGGDLTVEIPDSESEVGLLALSLNGLINDYGQIVGGIVHAGKSVQEGAARVDESVRRIVNVATNQAATVTSVANTMQSVAASAVDVQQATVTATDLASNARTAVRSGQDSVARIADAVDAIKQAAIGTTREFKRLQEDSIRLTSLVASVKNNAENLDMQAANAALEARHLGTESGSEFAANIGRLSRQAQDTLDDAEAAVRSVIASIDEVNRRIERISEQVRRGVEEVRQVRTTFEEITTTNTSLVQFIDGVADSAGIQARSAQAATVSITDIAQVFEHFRDQLIASGDEVANMRLIVAGLRESVADLKVDLTALPEHAPMGTETAA